MAKKSEKPKGGHDNNAVQFDGLFPPHLEESPEFADFFTESGERIMYSRLLESRCGATDDSQPVEQYDGTLGVSVSFVNTHQGPVGQLQWNNNLASLYTNPGNVSGVRWCTGTLISNDLFLTAGHCFDQIGGGWVRPLDNTTGTTIPPSEIARNMHVNFNYQVDSRGNLRTEQSFPILELIEYRLGSLDFAIVRLGGNPGTIFGTTAVSSTDAAVGDMVCIIGHPAGVPKRIEAGPVTNLHDSYIGYNDIDTLGGNSGSGILRASDGRIVGVHTNGGCTGSDPNNDTSHNHGVRISSIITQSPTLQSLIHTTPLYRYWNSGAGDHFYTTNWAELGSGRHGWGYEGIQCYVHPRQVEGSIPLYRYWNPGASDHFYTTNWAELGSGRHGWGYEGIQCYVFGEMTSPISESRISMEEEKHMVGEGFSAIPPSFATRFVGNQSLEYTDSTPSRFERSFITSKTERETAQVFQNDSFSTLSPSKSDMGKEKESFSQITINITLVPPKVDNN